MPIAKQITCTEQTSWVDVGRQAPSRCAGDKHIGFVENIFFVFERGAFVLFVACRITL